MSDISFIIMVSMSLALALAYPPKRKEDCWDIQAPFVFFVYFGFAVSILCVFRLMDGAMQFGEVLGEKIVSGLN